MSDLYNFHSYANITENFNLQMINLQCIVMYMYILIPIVIN